MQTYLERVRLIRGKIKVRVKPNSLKTEILGFKENLLLINIKASPENNKANIELVKFLSKLTKKKVILISGFNKKEKWVLIA